MINLSYDDILKKIAEVKGIERAEIEIKVQQKLSALSNLISKEGAAHIIANEYGVKLFEAFTAKRKYDVKELKAGIRGAEILIKVLKMNEIREFEKNGTNRRVVSLFCGDATGTTRVVFWDEVHIEKIKKGEIKEGDILKIKDGYVRDNNGFIEFHTGSTSEMTVNPAGETVIVGNSAPRETILKTIKELKENDNARVRGTIMMIFDPRFYSACPECNKKLTEGKCMLHGEVIAKNVPIVNVMMDDGTETIRVVAFRDLAETIMGQNVEKLKGMNPGELEILRSEIVGRQFEIAGRAVKNQVTNRLEFNAQEVKALDPEMLAKELKEKIN
ncbi:hypothetical protein J4468_04155 [Candidatus Woesearchaeota archaeon]|nr:hypothetical protein [Candidatus Woesearchaeota archaeon]